MFLRPSPRLHTYFSKLELLLLLPHLVQLLEHLALIEAHLDTLRTIKQSFDRERFVTTSQGQEC